MTSQTEQQKITRHISPNISRTNRGSYYKNMVAVVKLGYFVSYQNSKCSITPHLLLKNSIQILK